MTTNKNLEDLILVRQPEAKGFFKVDVTVEPSDGKVQLTFEFKNSPHVELLFDSSTASRLAVAILKVAGAVHDAEKNDKG